MSTDPAARARFHARAPIRVDLAGGTLDIWPLYLLLKNPVTVNLAIDLHAEAWIEEKDAKGSDAGVEFVSRDQGSVVSVGWSEFDKQEELPPWVALPWRLLRHFIKKKQGFDRANTKLRLETLSRSPAGAGLGGSSGLNISATGALAAWAGVAASNEDDRRALIEVSKDSETQVLRVPAGLQDYYGAMFGGLQSIRWSVARHERLGFPDQKLREVSDRLLLFYSGQSRNSGINNWSLFKALIDGDASVHARFESIGENAMELARAIQAGDTEAQDRSIHAEWEVRRTLAPGITTPEIDSALLRASKQGARAAKICGAGGGGCFFVLSPDADPARKKRIADAVTDSHVRLLPFSPSSKGLESSAKG